jgi:hypothetical protein
MAENSAPDRPNGITLSDQIQQMVNTSFTSGNPMVVAYVDANGSPRLSYRGSAIACSDTQLAIWAREGGGLLTAIAANPRMTMLYRDPGPKDRATLQFSGLAHIEVDETIRDDIFSRIPEAERNRDPERKGAVVILDLDSVEGFMPDGRIEMRK